MIKAVLFDLDGTLIDTAKDFVRIIQHMCREKGCDVVSEEVIRSQVSEGATAMVQLVYPELARDSEEFLHQRQRFLAMYGADIAIDTALFDGIDDILQQLEQRQILWGIVTNKPRDLSVALLQALNLTARCAVLVCPEDVSQRKPDPEPIYLAAKLLGLPVTSCIYVGDHPRDIDAGKNANIPTILAAYGYLPPESADDLEAWGADHIVANVAELKQCIFNNIET